MSQQASRIIIATLLPEKGFCGVQTHFRAIRDAARAAGHEVKIAEPHLVTRWLRIWPGVLVRVLRKFWPEKGVLWHRRFARKFLYMRLLHELQSHAANGSGKALVIYAQDPLSASVALELRKAGYDFRLVMVSHFNISEAYENQLNGLTQEGGPLWRSLMRLERKVLPKLDLVVFVSRYMQRIVQARIPALSKVPQQVIHNFPEHAAALVKAVTDSRVSVPDEPVQSTLLMADIISIGTLEPRKNQAFLLYVLAAANALGYRYTLTLAGDGPSRGQWQSLAKQLGVDEQVNFLGYVPNAAALLPKHRVYAHAAQMENMPLTLIEAMSNRLPIFAAGVGGIPEIMQDGVHGWLWPLNDAKACAQLLVTVLESPMLYRMMSNASATQYRKHLATSVLAPIWLENIIGSTAQFGNEVASSNAQNHCLDGLA